MCVASCPGSWQEEEGRKESKIQVFLVPVGSCSESPESSTVNWGWDGGVLGNKSCMRTIFKTAVAGVLLDRSSITNLVIANSRR